MLYIILTSVVFVAELIVLIAIITNLIKIDKKILAINNDLEIVKPKIAEIMSLINKISNQIFNLVQDKLDDIREKFETDFYKELSKLIILAFMWKTNKKFMTKIHNSKLLKSARNWLKILAIVV